MIQNTVEQSQDFGFYGSPSILTCVQNSMHVQRDKLGIRYLGL